MHFDLVDLRLMANIAAASSLTRGAEASHLSVPAASKRIKLLEEGCGSKLLHRSSHGVALTAAGEALVQHANIVLRQLDHLRGDLEDHAKGVKAHLRVLSNTSAMEFRPAVLNRFLQAHPNVNIELKELPSADIVRAVADREADIGIVASSIRTEPLEFVPYRYDRLMLVLPADHAMAGAAMLQFEQTLDLQHIGLLDGSALTQALRRVCTNLGRALPLRIQVGNFETACRMVEARVGVAVVPATVASRLAEQLAIRLVPLSDAWSIRELEVCVRRLADLSATERDLMDLLVEDGGRGGEASSQVNAP